MILFLWVESWKRRWRQWNDSIFYCKTQHWCAWLESTLFNLFSLHFMSEKRHTHTNPIKKKKIEAATKYCRSLLLIFSGWYSRFGCCCFRISWFWFDAVSVVLCHQSAAVLLLSLYKICMCARLIMNDNNKIVWFALKLKWILTSFWQMNRTRDVWLLALRVFISFDIENLTHTGTQWIAQYQTKLFCT